MKYSKLENYLLSKIEENPSDKLIPKLYENYRNEFYNFETYKWSSKKATLFIKRLDMDTTLFISKSKYLIEKMNELKGLRGYKTANKFISKLPTLKKIQSGIYSKSGIPLNNIDSYKEKLQFLESMSLIEKKYSTLSQNKWIEHIHKNYDTGLTLNTLRNYYKDKINKKDTY